MDGIFFLIRDYSKLRHHLIKVSEDLKQTQSIDLTVTVILCRDNDARCASWARSYITEPFIC